MRDVLEQLLRAADSPTQERAQLRWDEYRAGADATDPAARAAAGAAFATLLAWYGGALYRHIWGFVRSDGAEDVFQDVLRKLHQNRRNPRLASFHDNVLPWVRRVAIRECVEAHRKATRRLRRESRAARPEEGVGGESRAELDEALVAALGRLPAEQQQAVALHYFEGLTRQEAAADLGINRDTFAARLNAALERLRKLMPVPVSVALGGVIDVPAALAVPPPALPAARLSELAANALATAPSGWALVKPVTVLLLGLTISGGVAAGWVLTHEGQPAAVALPPADVRLPAGPQAADPVESLQARNERVTRDELVEPLRELLQRFYPADNPVRFHSLRAIGSEVVVEFRVEPPPPAATGLPALVRARFCTFRRQLFLQGWEEGRGRWYDVNPERPYAPPILVQFGPPVNVVLGREEYAGMVRVLDRLPRDPRGGAEMLRHLFGTPGGELLLPEGMLGVSGFPGGMVLTTRGGGLFVRNTSGRWRYAGGCPSWFPVVAGDRVYCMFNGISSRRLDEPAGAWMKWCDLPPQGPEERRGVLFLADGRLQVGFDPGSIASHPLDNPAAGWSRASAPVRAEGLAAVGGTIFGNDGKRLYARPAAEPNAEWVPVGPWPDERYRILVADRDHLLALDHDPGPIYGRRVKAAPDEQWAVVGRIHDPYKP